MVKFSDDLDNSEEEDLSDDELVAKIKARKDKERCLRSNV